MLVEQRVAEAEADAQLPSLVEQRLRRLVGHRPFVPVVGFGDVVDEPPREERRQRQLRIDHELDAMVRGFAEQLDHPADDLLAAVITLHRPELRGSNGERS